MDRGGGLRRRRGPRLPRAGKAEEYLCCLATVNKDIKRFFQTAARGGPDDLVDELSPLRIPAIDHRGIDRRRDEFHVSVGILPMVF